MAHVVAEPCFDCKYTDCVVVCPVDCFYEGAQMLYIHPDECIDCEACVPSARWRRFSTRTTFLRNGKTSPRSMRNSLLYVR